MLQAVLDDPPVRRWPLLVDEEEYLEEALDHAAREELVEALLRVPARESQRHEGELEHGVALLVRASGRLDFVECSLHDADLSSA